MGPDKCQIWHWAPWICSVIYFPTLEDNKTLRSSFVLLFDEDLLRLPLKDNSTAGTQWLRLRHHINTAANFYLSSWFIVLIKYLSVSHEFSQNPRNLQCDVEPRANYCRCYIMCHYGPFDSTELVVALVTLILLFSYSVASLVVTTRF